jgi:hypothetical protein
MLFEHIVQFRDDPIVVVTMAENTARSSFPTSPKPRKTAVFCRFRAVEIAECGSSEGRGHRAVTILRN